MAVRWRSVNTSDCFGHLLSHCNAWQSEPMYHQVERCNKKRQAGFQVTGQPVRHKVALAYLFRQSKITGTPYTLGNPIHRISRLHTVLIDARWN